MKKVDPRDLLERVNKGHSSRMSGINDAFNKGIKDLDIKASKVPRKAAIAGALIGLGLGAGTGLLTYGIRRD
jgi:hypothetical protein